MVIIIYAIVTMALLGWAARLVGLALELDQRQEWLNEWEELNNQRSTELWEFHDALHAAHEWSLKAHEDLTEYHGLLQELDSIINRQGYTINE